MKALLLLFLPVCATYLLGCGQACNSLYKIPQYKIVVTDASSGAAICDALVFVNHTPAVKGDWQGDCFYAAEIPHPPPDRATLEVQRSGYTSVSQMISVDYEVNSCGQQQGWRTIKVQLEPMQ